MHAQQESSSLVLIRGQLRPGDVILTTGSEKSSGRIAKATKALFSHAIIVASEDQWFEADEEGVGYSDLIGLGGILKGPGTHHPLLIVPDCTGGQVFRHPALAKRSSAEIQSAIAEIVRPWEGEDYSDYRRLFAPLKVSGKPTWRVRFALAFRQWKESRSSTGMFCSEVVARIFEALEHRFPGAALFSVRRAPEMVHPGHLASSRLEPVPGAVVEFHRLQPGTTIEPSGFDWDRRSPTTFARFDRSWAEGMRRSAELIQKTNETIREIDALGLAQLEHRVRRLVERAEGLGAKKAASKFRTLLEEAEANDIQLKRHFMGRDGDVAEYYNLSMVKVRLQMRANELLIEMLEEAVQNGLDIHAQEIRGLRELVQARNKQMEEKMNHLPQEFLKAAP